MPPGRLFTGLGLGLLAGTTRAGTRETLHRELRGPLTALTRSYFGPEATPSADGGPRRGPAGSTDR